MYIDHNGKAYLAAVATVAGVVVLAGSCAATVGLTCVLTVGGASTLVGIGTLTVAPPQYYPVIGPHTPQTTGTATIDNPFINSRTRGFNPPKGMYSPGSGFSGSVY